MTIKKFNTKLKNTVYKIYKRELLFKFGDFDAMIDLDLDSVMIEVND